MKLTDLGWDSEWEVAFAAHAAEGRIPGRVAREIRGRYRVLTETGALDARLAGRLVHGIADRTGLPAVGDWAALNAEGDGTATIAAALPRRSAFVRKGAGPEVQGQVAAANVDAVFLVMGLDGDYNLRRLERYLALAWESGATPVIVLNKADLCPDLAERTDEVSQIAFGVQVHVVSAADATGLDALRASLAPGRTVALLGSSGVGKSTLVNAFLGEERMRVSAVREDDSRGRHTTTHRDLIALPGGGLLIDTPGMRELGMWGGGEGLDKAFGDIEAFAEACRFRDCTHDGEPGCAVQAAVEAGELDAERLEAFRALCREQAYYERKHDDRARLAERNRWKQIAKLQKRLYNGR